MADGDFFGKLITPFVLTGADMMTGKLNAQSAFMGGKLKIAGNMVRDI